MGGDGLVSKIIKLNVTGRESVVWLENQKLKAAIERVRELAEKFEQEPLDEMVNYHLVARRIFTAIKDGDN